LKESWIGDPRISGAHSVAPSRSDDAVGGGAPCSEKENSPQKFGWALSRTAGSFGSRLGATKILRSHFDSQIWESTCNGILPPHFPRSICSQISHERKKSISRILLRPLREHVSKAGFAFLLQSSPEGSKSLPSSRAWPVENRQDGMYSKFRDIDCTREDIH